MRLRIIAGVSVASLVLITACTAGAPASPDVPEDAADLVRARCTRCHSVERLISADKDAAAWEETISRMRAKGADLSDDEARQLVDFLANGGASEL